MFKSRIN